jgi:hypothetical protein
MTPDEHYREAERLLDTVARYDFPDEARAQIIAKAQVHATLATIYRSTERLTS